MVHLLRLAGAVTLAAALGAASAAQAQTAASPHRHGKSASAQKNSGRQITVRKGNNSYLTMGGAAGPAVTSPNNYVLDTFSPPTPIQNTFMQGRTPVLDNRFDGPGIPLFRF
jgi:hypothetical protein